MNSLVAAIAILSIVALSALALSVFAMFQTQAVLRAPPQFSDPVQPQHDAALDQMRISLEGLASQIRELQVSPPAGTPNYKAGLNLSKRSQALRMHRRGEPTEQIATALEIPHQEVELLIKVQRIVLSKL